MPIPPSLRPRAVARRAHHAARRIERRLPGRAAVLAYHRVASVDVDPWELAVTPAHFAEQLAVLRDRGTVRRLDELLADSATTRVRGPPAPSSRSRSTTGTSTTSMPPSRCSRRPTLRRPCSSPPACSAGRRYWWDVLAALVLGSDLEPARVLAAARAAGVVDGDGPAAAGDARAVHDLIHSTLIRRHVDAIEADLDRLAASLGVDRPVPDGRPMTVAELTTLAAHPLDRHRRAHDDASPAPRPAAGGGPRGDRRVRPAARRAARRPADGCSPTPTDRRRPTVVAVADDLGFEHAVTTESRWLRRRGEDLLAPRLHPRDVDGPTFDEWLRVWT